MHLCLSDCFCELCGLVDNVLMNSSSLRRWELVRFDFWIDPIFDQRIQAAADIHVQVAQADGDEARSWDLLARAHVYQISPAKDELPKPFHATAQLLAQCPNLLCVSSTGAGFDPVDLAACTQAGVAVVSQIGANAGAVAEMAIGLMLSVSRRIAESDRLLRSARGYSRESLMGHDLAGKVLGLVGIGHAGTYTATLARAFGMQVLAYDPFVSDEEVRRRGAQPVGLNALIVKADIVSLHCPRNPQTLHLFDVAEFAAMKPGALFISTARGGIHNEQALAAALQCGHLAGAGLDVWEPEPPALDHPLLALPNVVATYHTAGVSHEGRRNVAAQAADQVIGLLAGQQPARIANPEVWPQVLQRIQAMRNAARSQQGHNRL